MLKMLLSQQSFQQGYVLEPIKEIRRREKEGGKVLEGSSSRKFISLTTTVTDPRNSTQNRNVGVANISKI